MMDTKQLVLVVGGLGKNSRNVNSFAASEVSENNDTKCAKTLRNIIENSGTSTKSLAAAAIPSPSHNVNRVKTLYNFVINNHLR